MHVESAKLNMMDHIVSKAALSAVRYNAFLRGQRKSFGRVFKLDKKKRAIDRDNLRRTRDTFLTVNYSEGNNFVPFFNNIQAAERQYQRREAQGAAQQSWQPKHMRKD